MKQHSHRIEVGTSGSGLLEITTEIEEWVGACGITTGLLTVFCRHTSASLLIQENASPAARRDLEAYFARLAPEAPGRYTHDEEGPDDMPAHLRSALTTSSLSIPVAHGKPVLGTWQGIFLFEHRNRPHRRTVVLHLIGE